MAAATAHSLPLVLLSLSLAAIGIWGALGPFWAMATSFLAGPAAAAGIALINAVGNLGGFFGPYLMGRLKDLTIHYAAGLVVLAAMVATGAWLLSLHPKTFEAKP